MTIFSRPVTAFRSALLAVGEVVFLVRLVVELGAQPSDELHHDHDDHSGNRACDPGRSEEPAGARGNEHEHWDNDDPGNPRRAITIEQAEQPEREQRVG